MKMSSAFAVFCLVLSSCVTSQRNISSDFEEIENSSVRHDCVNQQGKIIDCPKERNKMAAKGNIVVS